MENLQLEKRFRNKTQWAVKLVPVLSQQDTLLGFQS